MVKVGIKNLMKLIKKCISESFEQTSRFLDSILDRFLSSFPNIDQTEITAEYLYELLMLLDFYKTLRGSEEGKV